MENPNLVNRKKLRNVLNHIGLGFIVYCMLSVGIDMGYNFILNEYPSFFNGYNMESINLIIDIVSSVFVYFVPFLVVAYSLKIKQKDLINFPKVSKFSLLAYTSMTISIYFMIIFIVSGVFTTLNIQFREVISFFDSSNLHIRLSYSFYFIFILPFFVEYIFRGIILKSTSKFGAVYGMLLSSAMYALFMLGRGDVFASFFVAILFSLITMMYKSIIPTYIMNIGLHAVVVLSLYLPMNYSWVIGLITVVAYAISFYYLYLHKDQQIVFNEAMPIKDTILPFFTSISFLAVLCMIAKEIYFFIEMFS